MTGGAETVIRIEPAGANDLPPLAALIAASPLQRRYGVTPDSALGSLRGAVAAGDTLLVARPAEAPGADQGALLAAASSSTRPTVDLAQPVGAPGGWEPERAGSAASHAGRAQPVGVAWLIGTRAFGGAAYLRLLLVAEAWQGRGLGARLLTAAEAAAGRMANHMFLFVTRDNAGARRFYERHGYRHVGDLPAHVRPDIDEALYHRPLRVASDVP